MRKLWLRASLAGVLALALVLPTRPGGWFSAPSAHAAFTTVSTTLISSADTYVDAAAPTTNFGSSPSLVLGASPAENAYLRFTVPNLAGTVVRAALRLYVLSSQTAGYAVHYLASNSWSQSTLTYDNAPAFNSGVAAQSSAVSSGEWTEVDVTPLISAGGTYDFVLTTGGTTALDLGSGRSSTPPQLVVDITAGSGAPVIIAAGDIACSPTDTNFNGGSGTAAYCQQRATANLLSRESPAAILPVGDNQYSATLANFQQVYGTTWGVAKPLTYPVPGNHEYLVTNAGGYYNYFGSAAGSPAQGYYSYNIGSWHIIALNAECSYIGGCGWGSSEEKWLRSDLSNHPALCTLAYWHQAAFTSGMHGNDSTYAAFWWDLYQARAEVVLNGHDHDYERFAPQNPWEQPAANGITEFVVGTGGDSHTGFDTVQPTSVTRNNTTFGVLKLTLGSGAYDWEYIPDGQSGSYTDFGHAACH